MRNLIFNKLPRGVIYHNVLESLKFLAASIFMPLDDTKKIREFEKIFAHYNDRKYCVAFPFARTAIYFILKGLNLPKGSEVIMPPITIKGIVDVVISLGLKPRYIDLDPSTMCLQIDGLHSYLNPVTKVAIITPLFGLVPDVTRMVKILRDHGIFIIEDFSQCLNGRFNGKRIGTFGDVGVYSASSIKTLDTLGGGLVITDSESLKNDLRGFQSILGSPIRKFLIKKAYLNLVRNIATTQPCFSLITFWILQSIRKCNPELALKQTGNRDKKRLDKLPSIWFQRYTSVQADIGLKKLGKVISDDFRRIENVKFLKDLCGFANFPETTPQSENVYWQLIMFTKNSLEAQSFFANRGVDIATSSLELVSALKGYPNQSVMPEAERIYRNGIFIPCYPNLSLKNLELIATIINEFADESQKH